MEKLLFAFVLSCVAFGAQAARPAVVADHTCTDISKLKSEDIEKAKAQFRVWYGHTSHGSQILSGMKAMARAPFQYSRDGKPGVLSLREVGGDLGHRGSLDWANNTRAQLNAPGNDRNLVVWSWCGGASDNTPEGVDAYLDAMAQLEQDFPGVTFVYMTGHLDGGGADGLLNKNNERIRKYCVENGKVLFDFADIESFDPDGETNFLKLRADDACNYQPPGGERRNWAVDWLARNPGHHFDLPSSAAHTQPLNGALKGRAFWWLLATLASQDRGAAAPPPSRASAPVPAKAAGPLFSRQYRFKSINEYRDWSLKGVEGTLIPETGGGLLVPRGNPALALYKDRLRVTKLRFTATIEQGDHVNWYIDFQWDGDWKPAKGIGGVIRGDGAMLTLDGEVERIPNSQKSDIMRHTYEVSIKDGVLLWKRDGKLIVRKELPEGLADREGQLGVGAWGSLLRVEDIYVQGYRL